MPRLLGILCFCAAAAAWLCDAAIVDLMVIEGRYSTCPAPYSKIHTTGALDGNFNEGATGSTMTYIWLCVKTSDTEKPITGITMIASAWRGVGLHIGAMQCRDLGSGWHSIPERLGSNGDFNHGSRGKYIYLCYEKKSSGRPLRDLNLKTDSGKCKRGMHLIAQGGSSNGDFNQFAGGKYIYMCASWDATTTPTTTTMTTTTTTIQGGAGCPWALNTGSVGSCKIFGCSASRGPTHCTLGSCYCNAGFCRYPASSLHLGSRYCVQRVPGNTCHLSRVCYNAGLTTTFCEKGLCMCKWGYRLDSNNKCVSSSSSWFALTGMGNSTEDLDFLREQDNVTAHNVGVFALWVAGFVTAITAGVIVAYRKFRAQPEEDENMYFLSCE